MTLSGISRAIPRIRAAILTGAGEKAFVAGADINELAVLSALQARDYAARGTTDIPPARDLA